MRGLGYIPDEGRSEHIYGARTGLSLPAVNMKYCPHAPKEHAYQDGAEGCVGFGIATAAYTKMSYDNVSPLLYPSPGFIWWNSRKTHGGEDLNIGTYPSRAFETLNTLGMAPNDDWSWHEVAWRFAEKPSRIAYTHAFDSSFDIRYSKIYGYDEDLKYQVQEAIYSVGPLTFGMMVTQSCVELAEHDVDDGPKGDNDEVKGGHYLTLLGYDEKGPIGLGSWRQWGNDDWFHLTWRYFLEASSDIVAFRFVPTLRGRTRA
jgi:hypothetical protein